MKDKRGNKQYLEYGEQTIRLFPELYSAKEGPNGERVMARTVTFQVTDDCNLMCKYCVSAGTKILLDNYDLKNIEDIKVGDSVLGFEENVSGYYRNKVMKAKVLNTFHRKSKVLEIETENGLKLNITDNHKILSSPKKTFIEVGKLKVGDKIYYHPLIDLANKKNLSELINYKIGYITGIFKGDGSIKNYTRRSDNAQVYKTRLAVKDKEIIQRTKKYLDDLDFNTYLKPFMVSKKYNLKEDAIFSNRKDTYFNLLKLFEDNFKKNTDEDYCRGFLAGIYDAEGSFCKSRFLRICNTDKDIIDEIIRCLDKISIEYILEESGKTKNKEHRWNIRIDAKTDSKNSFNFLNIINSTLQRKSFEGFLDYAPLKTLEIKSIKELPDEIDVYNLETETGTYIANGIAVHNCYQGNKGKRRMSFETAKKFVDYLLDADESNHYINPTISPFIIIDFIGGEPFLEIDLIEKIVNYFNDQCFLRQHPWATRHRFSICSNGVLYFDPRVQEFMHKNRGNISFSVTIDGNKELHDSCRVFPDGSPSYDLAVAAAQDWMNQGNYMGSKITIAPGNVQYLSGALKHMVELGYTEINANCVYEEGWELEHAQELYRQMKIFSDYLIENNLYRDIFCSLYQENFFQPKDPRDNQNWCGGTGLMLACDPDGWIYPCLRYMESSLGDDQLPLRIGHVDRGIETLDSEKEIVKCLDCITRRSQSTDECFYCPIAEGCSWCSAYNYQVFGTADARATFICIMHRARALGNLYYFNKIHIKENEDDRMLCYVPKEWAIPIIGEEEFSKLIEDSGGRLGISPFDEEFRKAQKERESN